MIPLTIDLNCDMGELPELAASGNQTALLNAVSSINVACGAHAGNPQLIERTIRAAQQCHVAIGAHPGFPDRQNFGRRPMVMEVSALAASLHQQLRFLAKIAASCGVSIQHVKPHGALYNLAAWDERIARIIAEVARQQLPDIPLLALAGSPGLRALEVAGFRAIPEAFADRRYEADGRLRARDQADAIIPSATDAVAQAVSIASKGMARAITGEPVPISARTLCIHSDTPGADALAIAVRIALEKAGIRVAPVTGWPTVR